MKKSKLKIILPFVCLMLSLSALISCEGLFPFGDPIPERPSAAYTVSFETNGGSAAVSAQVNSGKNIASAPASEKAGYVLAGWFDNAELSGAAVTFPYTPAKDITLYAKWNAAEVVFNPRALPGGTYGAEYSESAGGASANGGTLTYSLQNTSALPAGLNLEADGTVSGTPALAGRYSFTVTAVCAETSKFSDAVFSIEINKKRIEKPALTVSSFDYDGTEKNVTLNSDLCTLSGVTRAANAGTYTVTASIADPVNYEWSDGNEGALTLTWEITASIQSDIFAPHLIAATEREQNPYRYIANVTTTKSADTLDALYNAVVKEGKRPLVPVDPNNTVTKTWNAALKMLNDFILNGFDNYERVHTIYDWLVYYVDYDNDLLDRHLAGESLNGNDPAFHLSGVFIARVAVCDGISKAFSLLCAMENIPVERVLGWAGKDYVGHAWNKVNIAVPGNASPAWYAVDATWGNLTLTSGSHNEILTEYLTHAYFLVPDAVIAGDHFQDDKHDVRHGNLVTNGSFTAAYSPAVTPFNYYAAETVEYGDTEYSPNAGSLAEAQNYAVNYAVKARLRGIEIRLDFTPPPHGGYASILQPLFNSILTAQTANGKHVQTLLYVLTRANILILFITYAG